MRLGNVRKLLSSLLSTDLIQVTRDKEEDKLISVAELAKAVATGMTSASNIALGAVTATSLSAPSLALGVAQELIADGAITVKSGLVILNKSSAIAATLNDPSVDDDGKILVILSKTAQAHTVTIAGGLNGSGAGGSSDVGTFGAAVGNSCSLIALSQKWYRFMPSTGVTWG